MSLKGPSKDEKRAAAKQDISYLVQETWVGIGRNVIILFCLSPTVWLFCTVLRFLVEYGTEFLFEPFRIPNHTLLFNVGLANHPMFILLGTLFLGGVIRGILIQFPSWENAKGDGASNSIAYFLKSYGSKKAQKRHVQQRYEQPTFLEATKRLIITALTLGTGGSGGIEGPVIPIGECIGAGWSALFSVSNSDDLRVFEMAGIASAVTTLLNAPFTASLFAAEIVFTDRIVYRTLFYSLLASVIAFSFNNHFLHFEPLFKISMHDNIYSPQEYFEVTLVAIFCSAPAGLGVRYVFSKLDHVMQGLPSFMRASVAALCAGGIACLLWVWLGIEPGHVLGIGETSIKQLLDGSGGPLFNLWWVLFLLVIAKTFATGFTLTAGGSAGLLIPAMYMGAMTGGGTYLLLSAMGLPLSAPTMDLFVVAGIASSLVAIIEVPLAAIAFIMEVFGANFGPPAIVACVVCHLFAKRLRLYAKDRVKG